MKRYSKRAIKQLLVKWLGKIDKLFFEQIWKKRNEDMITWEENNNINKILKRKKISVSKRRPRSKKDNRDNNKIIFSGKKKSSVHVLDESLYNEIKVFFGLDRPNFH